jgi:hypothetical protein
MRVIRTEKYFLDNEFIKPAKHLVPGIAFAWFKSNGQHKIEAEDLKRILKVGRAVKPPDMRRFLSKSLYEQSEKSRFIYPKTYLADGTVVPRDEEARINDATQPLVAEIMAESIVVERSPPQDIPFKEVLKSAASKGGAVVLGSFIGWAVAPESVLMFLSIPAGIVVVGSAIGVSRGMENGLQDLIERLFKGEKPEPPTPSGTGRRKRPVKRRITRRPVARLSPRTLRKKTGRA